MTPELRFPEFSSEWQVKKLGDVVKFSRGNLLSKNDLKDDGRYKAIHYGELFTQYNEIIGEIKSRTDLDTGKKSLAGEILMPTSDVTPQGLARASVIHEDGVMIGGDINILKPDQEISSDFLSYLLNSQKKKIMRLVSGTTVRHVYASDLRKASYVFPQKPEQEKIAEFLTAVDARIAVGEQKLASLAQYKKAVMQQIFSQQIRFKKSDGSNYPDWQEKRIGEIGEVIGGGTPATSDKKNWDGSIYWLTPTEVKQKYITKSKKTITDVGLRSSSAKLLPKGTVIFTSRATVGDVAISEVELTTNQGFQSVVVNRQNSNEFIYYWITFNKTEFLRRANGSTFPEISGNKMKKMKIPIPASEEQQKIATFLTTLDARITAETTRLTSAKEWKKGLLQRMFV